MLWPLISVIGDRWSLVSSLCRCGNSARLWKGGSSTSTGLVPPLLHCSCRCPAAELVTVLQRFISCPVSEYIIIIIEMFQNQSPCITCWASQRMSSFTSLCSTSFSSPSTSASSSSSSSTCHSTSSGGEDSRETAGTSVTESPCTSHCQNCSL